MAKTIARKPNTAGKKQYSKSKPKSLEHCLNSKDFKQLPDALKSAWVLKNQAHINDPDLIKSKAGKEYFDWLFILSIAVARRHIEINDTQKEDDSTYSSAPNTP